jgi:hypothetical protein
MIAPLVIRYDPPSRFADGFSVRFGARLAGCNSSAGTMRNRYPIRSNACGEINDAERR